MPQNSDNIDGIQTISYLVLEHGGAPKKYAIDDHLIVGRDKGPVKITNSTLSARHASLFFQDGVVSIMDHRSEFGTFINGNKLTPGKMYVLLDEDEIKFGEILGKLASGVKEVMPDLPDLPPMPTDMPSAPPMDEKDFAKIEDDIATSSISIKDLGTNADLEFNITNETPKPKGEAPPLPGVKDLSELRLEHTQSGISRVDGTDFPDEGTKEMKIGDLLKESQGSETQEKKVQELFKGNEAANLVADDRSGLIDWNEKTSILKRFKDRFMPAKEVEESLVPKKTRVKVPKQKTVKVERSLQTANALLRILALLIDVIVTYIFFDSIKETLEMAGFFKLLEQNFMGEFTTLLESYILNIPVIGSWIDVGANAILTIMKAIMIFFLLRMSTAFVFGVSIGQLCLGMRGAGGGLKKRFSGFLRELFGALTVWVLVLDLPTVFSKRSFKEVLSGSMVCSATAITSGLLIGIFIPFWLLMALILPLFQNFEISPSWIAEDLTTAGPTNSREAVTEPSKYFMMGIPETKDPFWMVPAINIKIASGKKILTPIIYFYHPELKEEVKWTIYKRVDLGKAVAKAFRLNPLADKTFPVLANLLKNVEVGTNVSKMDLTEEDRLKIRLELVDFIKQSLKVTAPNLINHVTDFGPFINSYVSMKNYLINLMEFEKPNFEFLFVGDKVFLKAWDRRGGIQFNHFLPIELGESLLYQSSFKSGKMKIAFNKFSEKFTFKPDTAIDPKPSLAWIDKLQENAEDINPKMLDLIAYFKAEGKRSFEEENFDYLALLEKALKQNYQGYKKLKGEIPEELDIKFQELLLSFKDRNRFYFTGSEKSYKPEDKPDGDSKKEISIEKAEEELFGE